ncbi:MAG: hypothetical protein II681_05795 [Bacteroidaceae bacterium]|nr:hypothetical protein [Bacteroidaceae bacterium]
MKFKHYFLSVALMAMGGAGTAMAWDEPTQVDGVYQIGTASELEWFAEYVNSASSGNTAMLNAKAVLTADIDMTDVSHTPIGPSTTYKYDGEFDGQHHVISNMIIDLPEKENVGLFGIVRGNAVIKNIIIDSSCSIKGKNRVAGIIGSTQTVADKKMAVLNCVNMASVHAYEGVAAGIIGAGQSQYPFFKMHNCVNTGAITTDAEKNYTVAFNGWNNSAGGNAQVWSCYNAGTLSKIDGVNNLFRGSNRSTLNSYDVVNKDATYQSRSNVPADIISNGFQTADPLHSGELCYYLNHGMEMMGRSEVTEGEEYTQDLSDPNSIPMPNAAGPKVYQVANYYCNGKPKGSVVYSNVNSSTVDEHVKGANFVCVNCNNYAFDGIEDYKTPDGEGYYHLSTVEDVEWFAAMVNLKFHGAMNAKLDNDIDFGGVKAHQPIGCSAHKYGGHFDGQGHRIIGMKLTSDLVLSNPDYDGVGFFGSLRAGIEDAVWGVSSTEATVENLIIDKSCDINVPYHWVGGIAGHINAGDGTVNILNCGNEANITAAGDANAGIIGISEQTAYTLNIIGCWNTGNITGTGKNCAGIFGGNSGSKTTVTIRGCWNTGNVTATNENAAITGWIGSNTDPGNEISGCWNKGTVTGLDGTKSLYRGTATNYGLADAQAAVQEGTATLLTDDMFASGELCYRLNGDQSTIRWTQKLDGSQDTPAFDAGGDQVYMHGSVYCDGTAAPGTVYNNEGPDGVINIGHEHDDALGMCIHNCDQKFDEPALVDGWYELTSAGNIEWFAAEIQKGNAVIKGKMMNDIDFGGVVNLHNPIGNNPNNHDSDARKFNGEFDGQGHRITNLIIDRPSANNQGFFGYVRGGGTSVIKNLILDKTCSITGNGDVAGIAAKSQITNGVIEIINCVNEATVTAKGQNVGGIFGGIRDASVFHIYNCVNAGTITSENGAPYAGALAGWIGNNGNTIIKNFINVGTVNGYNGTSRIGRTVGTVTNLIDAGTGATAANDYYNAASATSGELAYAANQAAGEYAFFQNIGTDEYPSPLNEGYVNKITAAGYATQYIADKDVEIPAAVKAYAGKVNGSYLNLTEVADKIPAATAVVLEGAEGFYSFMPTTGAAAVAENDLKGTATALTADGSQYVLAKKDDVVGFYQATEGTIAAGKAYLTGISAGVKAVTFGTADGIASPLSETEEGAAIYDLSGRRVEKATKGLYIINGKKTLK